MFRLPEEVKAAVEDYKRALKEAVSGSETFSRFKGIRVPWGIYSQRGGAVCMSRIRIPAGLVTAEQLKALAFVSSRYGNGALHITTRQDIQVHDVKVEDTVNIMEHLAGYDLSPRGGGGNTVRNVTACPLAGICPEEVFDVRPEAVALTEHLLRQADSFSLPRKFKIAFSGCGKDCSGCLVTDIGLIAVAEGGKEGFRVYTGGGMGANSRIGRLLDSFIAKKDMPYTVEAIKNIFYEKGNRRDKHHNRLRFLVEDVGFDAFKKMYEEALSRIKKTEHISLRKIVFQEKTASGGGGVPAKDEKEYKEFLSYSVRPQKQKGFSIVTLRVPRGDIMADTAVKISDLAKEFPGIGFRASQEQNLVITWVREADVYALFTSLKAVLRGFLYPDTLMDVVACKGALTCNLGLCHSPGLAAVIEDAVGDKFVGKKVFKELEIKINGCPNSCAQAPIGKLAFVGMARKVDNRPVPFYRFLIGGRKEGEFTKFGEEVGVIPARNVPGFLADLLDKMEEEFGEGAGARDVLSSRGKAIAGEVLEDYSYVPPYAEGKDFYVDWGCSEDFSLTGLGMGECSAGVMDMIESDLAEARVALEAGGKDGYRTARIKRAVFLTARALLVTRGKEPKTENEVFSDFKTEFLDKGIVPADYRGISDKFALTDKDPGPDGGKGLFIYAKRFNECVNALYAGMDSSFNFKKDEKGLSRGGNPAPAKVLDLKGTPCPINYVKTKLVLENMGSGDILEVLLDEGEPIENVPKSLEGDGHNVLKIEKVDGYYKITVRNK